MVVALLLSLAVVAPAGTQEDPFVAPPELEAFARRVTPRGGDVKARPDVLMDAIFRAPGQGGLGMEYDSTYTRTVAEVWRDRKANCLSLTALCVAALRAAGFTAGFAQVVGTSAWSRDGSLIRQGLHVVTVVPATALDGELVMGFDPRVRDRMGNYALRHLSASRVLALFHGNRAAGLLGL